MRHKTISLPTEVVGRITSLNFEVESLEKCMAYTHDEIAREKWRQKLIETRILYHKEIEKVVLQYGELNLDTMVNVTPSINYFDNTLFLVWEDKCESLSQPVAGRNMGS